MQKLSKTQIPISEALKPFLNPQDACINWNNWQIDWENYNNNQSRAQDTQNQSDNNEDSNQKPLITFVISKTENWSPEVNELDIKQFINTLPEFPNLINSVKKLIITQMHRLCAPLLAIFSESNLRELHIDRCCVDNPIVQSILSIKTLLKLTIESPYLSQDNVTYLTDFYGVYKTCYNEHLPKISKDAQKIAKELTDTVSTDYLEHFKFTIIKLLLCLRNQ